jgi:putative transposase
LIEVSVRNILDEEVEQHLAAKRHERSGQRRGYRNGTKPRTMKAAVGELHFDLLQVKEGGFRTQLFDRWQRSDKAMIATMQEIVIKGVSTRDVASILEEMGSF